MSVNNLNMKLARVEFKCLLPANPVYVWLCSEWYIKSQKIKVCVFNILSF